MGGVDEVVSSDTFGVDQFSVHGTHHDYKPRCSNRRHQPMASAIPFALIAQALRQRRRSKTTLCENLLHFHTTTTYISYSLTRTRPSGPMSNRFIPPADVSGRTPASAVAATWFVPPGLHPERSLPPRLHPSTNALIRSLTSSAADNTAPPIITTQKAASIVFIRSPASTAANNMAPFSRLSARHGSSHYGINHKAPSSPWLHPKDSLRQSQPLSRFPAHLKSILFLPTLCSRF